MAAQRGVRAAAHPRAELVDRGTRRAAEAVEVALEREDVRLVLVAQELLDGFEYAVELGPHRLEALVHVAQPGEIGPRGVVLSRACSWPGQVPTSKTMS
ncbi:hypothetical protein [Nonomuraea endophytica]|uniref:Uncharacterized protein n=1 Tax=Nonomuraea endophytica TaxID=714136 RepID=A0A7W8A6M5_9ACTN|nr:hypothetical protein [Nonomuraea endophytica]MBB5079203.1 hypothetical protein [Nonomuraea endophytica]